MLYQGAIIKLSRSDIFVANFIPPAKSASQGNYFLTKMRFRAYIVTIRAMFISNDVAKKTKHEKVFQKDASRFLFLSGQFV